MARKLTEQEIEDRLQMYEEAASHLEQSVCDTKGEQVQAAIVAKEIRQLADALMRRASKLPAKAHPTQLFTGNQEGEEWKDVEGYEGIYRISSIGRVLNVRTKRLLRGSALPSGYYTVNLCKDGYVKFFFRHRLVALHFIENPNPEALYEVNHKDGDKTNNVASNLEWSNDSLNTQHAYDMGLLKKEGKAIRQLDKRTGDVLAEYPTAKDAVAASGVGASSICSALKGKYQTAGGYKWQYANSQTTTNE